ncbi:MAG TPA: hypothetical protein VN665_01430 [Candidatus Paceibacterota bacterium]|nr:hypothetical protein [Candidatus Paceibacterota bacterium]
MEDIVILYKEFKQTGIKILLEAGEPAAVLFLRSLAEAMEKDGGYSSLCVLATPLVAELLAKQAPDLHLAQYGSAGTSEQEALRGPFEFAIAHMGPSNESPHSLLYTGKRLYGAKKLAYIATGFKAMSSTFADAKRANFDTLDLVMVTDELCAEVYRADFKWMDPDKIVPIGSAMLDALRSEDHAALRAAGRQKLGISETERVVFFSAFPGHDCVPFGAKESICVDALGATIAGVKQAAKGARSDIAVLVRPHPRATKEETAKLLAMCNTGIQNGLRVIASPDIAYDESLHAADLIACIATSTLSNQSRYRGQEALVFAFEDNDCGKVFDALFTGHEANLIGATEGIRIVRKEDDITAALKDGKKLKPIPTEGDSVKRLLEYLLTE